MELTIASGYVSADGHVVELPDLVVYLQRADN